MEARKIASGAPWLDDLIGQTIAGRYRIISQLGVGGMGTAYRAWDEQAGIPVVIKIPKKIFFEDPKFAERFRREIRLLQGLTHPHIVPITDVGEYEGLPFIVLRFLPGGSLSNRRLRDENSKVRPNPPGMLHLWLPAIAEALDFVHSQGVVHRDVKPGNIFFDAFWGAYLGDFGIAKIVEESETFDKEHTLTATHMGIGTQEYMCPEQFTPKAVLDGRADQYALAVMVYEMVAGTRPFTGATAYLIVEVTTMPVPKLDRQRPGLPASLVQAVHRGLAKNPQERFNTCQEFAYEVLRDVPLLADETDTARLLCPKCSNILKLPVSAAGQKGKCPRCQTEMKVADDLGALWLLDEARRQQRSSPTVVDIEDVDFGQEPGAAGTGSEIDEEALETFKPVSSTTPIEKVTRRESRKLPPVAIWGGVAGVLLAAVFIWNFLPGSKSQTTSLTYAEKVAKAEVILKSDPLNRAANEIVGRHWCFKEQNWDKGLPYLAKSNATGFASAAERELDARKASPASPGDLIRAAQSWWKFAKQPDIVSKESLAAIKQHSAAIYFTAVDDLKVAKDIDDTNQWLDRDSEFRALVGNKRPPKAPATASAAKYPAGTVVWEKTGHAYKVFLEDLEWHEANKQCERIGGHLVTINSSDEHAFVKSVLAAERKGRRFLAGASDEREEGQWRWVDGTSMSYLAWARGQPDNKGPSHFLNLDRAEQFAWDDGPAAGNHSGFICEWESGGSGLIANSIGMNLRLILPGTFQMGSSDGEPNEKPIHEVRLTKPFYLGLYEVTNAQWKAVMGNVPSSWKDDDRPAEQVSWDAAIEFCKKLSERPEELMARRVYRLPTEAEWEYACRAGTKTQYSFGDNAGFLVEHGWFDSNSGGSTHPVGKKKPNPWGLYDMHGNVHEWCSDWLGNYSSEAVVDPNVAVFSNRRVYRGGNWKNDARTARSAYRYGFSSEHRHEYLGFRVAVSLPANDRASPQQQPDNHAKPESPPNNPAGKPELAAAYAQLVVNPSNSAANGVIGRHLCFKEEQWPAGMPFLSKSDQADFARTANAELVAVGLAQSYPGSLVQIAKKWWTLSARKELNTTESKQAIRKHAVRLYLDYVLLLKSSLDVQFANDWLDTDKEFQQLVGNKRPPERPRTTFVFTKADLEKQFVLHGNTVITEKNEIECCGGQWGKAVTKSRFRIPLKVEFDAYAFADRTFDMDPGVLTDEAGGGGIDLHYGTNANTQTHLFVFGKRTTGLPHTRIEPGRTYHIAFDIDEFRKLTITIDGSVIHSEILPEDSRTEGHVSCCGGIGHVAYRGLSVVSAGEAQASGEK